MFPKSKVEEIVIPSMFKFTILRKELCYHQGCMWGGREHHIPFSHFMQNQDPKAKDPPNSSTQSLAVAPCSTNFLNIKWIC